MIGLNILISVYVRIEFDDTSKFWICGRSLWFLKLGPFTYYFRLNQSGWKFRASRLIIDHTQVLSLIYKREREREKIFAEICERPYNDNVQIFIFCFVFRLVFRTF